MKSPSSSSALSNGIQPDHRTQHSCPCEVSLPANNSNSSHFARGKNPCLPLAHPAFAASVSSALSLLTSLHDSDIPLSLPVPPNPLEHSRSLYPITSSLATPIAFIYFLFDLSKRRFRMLLPPFCNPIQDLFTQPVPCLPML